MDLAPDKELRTLYFHVGDLCEETPKNELRLARSNHGDYYLFDWSGDSPDTTDDGPCRVLLRQPLVVDCTSVSISVVKERSQLVCHTSTSHTGAVRLLNLLTGCGAPTPDVSMASEDAGDLLSILQLLHPKSPAPQLASAKSWLVSNPASVELVDLSELLEVARKSRKTYFKAKQLGSPTQALYHDRLRTAEAVRKRVTHYINQDGK